MFEFLEKYLMGPLTKLSQYKLVRAIQSAGMASISFVTIGSLFLVLNVLPMVIPGLEGFYASTFDKVTPLYMLANVATMGVIALYFLLVIGFEYTRFIAEEEDLDLSPITGMLLSLFGFFMLVPQLVKGPEGISKVNDAESGIINGWAIGDAPARFGATGIFTAIIVCFVTINIYKFFIKRDIRIKMPDSVPEGVANSFSALIPVIVIAILFILVNGILVSLGTDIFGLIAIPFGFVANLTGSWIGMIIIILFIQALWLVGIHGATIIGSILTPIYLYNMELNGSGSHIPLAGEFMNAFSYNGGSGATLGLVIMMAFLAKSQQFKLLGRASIVPGIFQINEPIIFGLPMVYNPNFAVPFLLSPMVSGSIAYFAISSGLVRPVIAQQPWPTPVGINGFIATGGDWKGLVLSLVCAVVNALIYYPFFKKRDNELYKEELESEQ
ncbi:PTS cellobiose transporter subunit IIC [Anaerococcus sp.]|uniref:PTS cellobiose transporter subunit IIC n=1 Tax=Anaerococcus sp. TaxID=1872515 RepID=UPI0027B9662D|nr:PTS cellobiose transporter subunit IIC [Anaerococcus sp.]